MIFLSNQKLKYSLFSETKCPHGTHRFDSKKCIKFFGDEDSIVIKQKEAYSYSFNAGPKLSWSEARQTCSAHHNGRLMIVNDFVENFKLSSLIRSRLADSIKSSLEANSEEDDLTSAKISFWSTIPLDSRASTTKLNSLNIRLANETSRSNNNNNAQRCMTKRLNHWQEEDCANKQAFICEYDAIAIDKVKRRRPLENNNNNNRNRLIRVACGSSSTLFSDVSSTTTTRTNVMVPNGHAKISKQNSIKNTQKPTSLFLPFNTASRSAKVDAATKDVISMVWQGLPLADSLKENVTSTSVSQQAGSDSRGASFLTGADLGMFNFS